MINDKNVALWHRYYIDVINFYIMKENDCQLIISNNKKKEKKKEYSTSDGWDVIRFQVSEEHRINRPFNTLNDFLDYWFHEYHNRQESSRLEPMYMKKNRQRNNPEFNKKPWKDIKNLATLITQYIEQLQRSTSGRRSSICTIIKVTIKVTSNQLGFRTYL